ncbi:tRNA (adenosine(37)-N6)-threonylcarbamoyltransferase complex dimerization subunit type 1 TsaB [Shouchella shacheensis]|uniref:tRNA (adenosine(37)-N6)-threonylcarbamoyltransferase complex dimerization subunit type 1 TsaB n=1 Tax=Shouchella shacheensis TaxID=1649580 RepID=UPI00073FCA0D|nr:tRNA (adenosine(37)-N6)-threonylcarbamoyltransferase complex dimerization subunit type 1 TsaB [Shouchella shacheensis]
MNNTLAIDTSTYVLRVAVANEHQMLGEFMTNVKKNHATRLMPATRQLLADLEMKPQDLDRIVVARGPGSYTGVRIAVTTAKTLAWSLSLPLVGVSTLEAMAQAGQYFKGNIVPIIDARRDQWYTALYRSDWNQLSCVSEERLTTRDDWLEGLKDMEGDFLFLGEDVRLHREAIEASLGERAFFPPEKLAGYRPGSLAMLGLEREAVASVHDFTPTYLQLAEAEAKWHRAQSKGQ